ncbi:MAG: M48 family metalloprotease [Pseudohongiellaceae bacterium]|nr:M48 family metalloprotease [Pseudohongiellaceae bacterium]
MKTSNRAVMQRFGAIVVLGLSLASCVVNPVTGQRELGLVSEAQELNIGAQQYSPSQQSQGGLYKVDPELTDYVQQVGQRLARVSDRDLPYEFVVLNSSVPNAWALPGGKIAINRGLLTELNNEAELAAVLGHEIVHAAARHGARAMERGILMQGAMVVGAVAAQGNEYQDYIVGGAQLGAQLLTQHYGRDAERESDTYGIRYMAAAGYDPAAAVSLQQTFVRLNEGRAQGFIDGLFSSHPPSQERVQNNRALVAQLRAEGISAGELGTQRYQQALAFLRENAEAYEAFDEAQELIAQDKLEEANRRIDQAISMLPNEARFHGLKGDIMMYQRRYSAAVEFYDNAIARDSEYFDYYLGRGVAFARQGNTNRANADLQASVNLLPTAMAMNELGTMALNANDRAAAKQYFQTAMGAQGAVGEQASAAFYRLDVSDNPANYIAVQAYVGDNNELFARVENRSPVQLSDVAIEFHAVINGELVNRTVQIGTMQGGQSGALNSRIRFPSETVVTQEQMSATVRSVNVD